MSGATSAIIRADLLAAWRDRRLPILFGLCLIVGLLTAWNGIASVDQAEAARVRAQAIEHEAWLRQPPINAHAAAHFGQMALKPTPRLAAYEPGSSAWLGRSVWLEAHVRDMAGARPGEDRADAFGFELTPAWALAMIAPIAIIALGFPLLSLEREAGLWRIMAASGLPPRRQFAARLGSLALLSAIALAPMLLAALATIMLPGVAPSEGFVWRAVGLIALALLYLGVRIVSVLAVAAWSASPYRALLVLVGLWALCILVMPRMILASADRAVPAPSAATFWTAVTADRKSTGEGIEPSNPAVASTIAEAMKRYNVRRMEDLPIGVAGILLQRGEEKGNAVYDVHFGALAAAYDRQRALTRALSILSPALAFRDASSVLAGTDELSHRAFTAAAEAHRRMMVAAVNNDVTVRGRGASMGIETTASAPLWRELDVPVYRTPRLNDAQRNGIVAGFAVLLLWLAAGLVIALLGVHRWGRS